LKNKKIKTKLLGIYLIATVIPITLVGFYLNESMKNVVLTNTINEVDANIDKLEMRLNATLDLAINVSDLIYINKDLKKILEQPYKNDLEIYNVYNQYPIFDEYLKYYREIENIRFYMLRDMITNSQFIHADEEIQSKEWFQRAVEKNGQISWEYIQDQWTNEYYLTLTRSVYGENNRLLGVLNIYIAPSNLSAIFDQELHNVYIALDNEKIVYSNQADLIGQRPYFTIKLSDIENGSYIFDDEFRDEPVKVYLRSFQPQKTLSNQIQISAIIPIQDVIEDANNVLFRGYTIIIISLVISISLILLLIKSIVQRIYSLRHAMDNVAQGNFEIKKLDLGEDEIGQAYQDLEVTVDSIKQLINEVYIHQINEEQWKRRQKESEFKMLASQINPHFLYNTLEMIRMKALMNNEKEIANIVRMLSKMMRASLEVNKKSIPLSEEIDLVKTYLEIQRMRFGDKINFDIDIKCNIDRYKVFPLLIQPLVENSVKHGIEIEADESFVLIRVYETESNLVIEVTDNGVGIPQEKLSEINRKLNEPDELVRTNKIGLYNVSQRIKLYYGNDYGLDLKSKLGSGTTVTLFLPLQKGSDENVKIINH